MTAEQILANLKHSANAQAAEGMAKFGITPAQALGISIPTLRKMAKEIGRNHLFAAELWASGIHEARILASMIDEPQLVTTQQMEIGFTILIPGMSAIRYVAIYLTKRLTPIKRLSSGVRKSKSLYGVPVL